MAHRVYIYDRHVVAINAAVRGWRSLRTFPPTAVAVGEGLEEIERRCRSFMPYGCHEQHSFSTAAVVAGFLFEGLIFFRTRIRILSEKINNSHALGNTADAVF